MQPKAPELKPDPTLAVVQTQAEQDQIKALQQRTQMDTSTLMARYGAQVALGNALAFGSPGSPAMPALAMK